MRWGDPKRLAQEEFDPLRPQAALQRGTRRVQPQSCRGREFEHGHRWLGERSIAPCFVAYQFGEVHASCTQASSPSSDSTDPMAPLPQAVRTWGGGSGLKLSQEKVLIRRTMSDRWSYS